VSLAARGARNMDSGVENLDDDELKEQLRRLARKVYVESVLTGIVLTALFLLIPL
jgi:hypothetical protein